MTTAWAHLPNAAVIGAVRADARRWPRTIWPKESHAGRIPAVRDALDAIYVADRAAVRDAVRTVVMTAAWDTLVALVAWDDCANLLDLPSDTLRTMADLCDAPACHQVVLLLPYVLVKESTKGG